MPRAAPLKPRLAAEIHDRLARQLMSGALAPGTRLKIRDLAASMGVSVTPVRDAVWRLVNHGGLQFQSPRDIRVPVLARARYLEIRAIRLELEGLAAERAALAATDADAERLEAILRENEAALAAGDHLQALGTNQRFHLSLPRIAGMPVLGGLLENLWLQMGPLIASGYRAGGRVMIDHHYAVLDAIRAGDGAGARAAICADILAGGEVLLQSGTLAEPDGSEGTEQLGGCTASDDRLDGSKLAVRVAARAAPVPPNHPAAPPAPAPADDALLDTPPPAIDAETATRIARDRWGIDATARLLSSERDRNFRLTDPGGRQFVLKFSNPVEPPGVTNLQTEALRHIAARDPALPVPRVIPDRDGAAEVVTRLSDGTPLVTRVLSWIDGQPMDGAPPTPALRREAGRMLGRIDRALADFRHPSAEHALLWDIRRAGRLRDCADAVTDPALRRRVLDRLDRFDAETSPRLDRLRRQAVHGDPNPHNVIVAPGAPDRVAGVIDFGDMVHTALAADAAIGASYVAGDDPIAGVGDFIAGFHSACPLTDDEIALMPDLIALRMLATIVIASWRAARHPGNAAYILRNVPTQRAGLDRLEAVGAAPLARALHARCAEVAP